MENKQEAQGKDAQGGQPPIPIDPRLATPTDVPRVAIDHGPYGEEEGRDDFEGRPHPTFTRSSSKEPYIRGDVGVVSVTLMPAWVVERLEKELLAARGGGSYARKLRGFAEALCLPEAEKEALMADAHLCMEKDAARGIVCWSLRALCPSVKPNDLGTLSLRERFVLDELYHEGFGVHWSDHFLASYITIFC